MSHYNLRSRQSATQPLPLTPATQPLPLTPPTSPTEHNLIHQTIPEQPIQPPSSTTPKQDTPQFTSNSESKPYLQTPEDFVANEKRR
ncbi:hypothetical protein DPMN_118536 [Dreissena polymorpha]|uniref:Uncharacterized protein n=1 Tax=Dreissena polymorpha TaxID=45954 RepID=A0A9D4JLZ9_DREPO|nr:hypothetical protein DPMN_118536 [Dreissena polymorpha]